VAKITTTTVGKKSEKLRHATLKTWQAIKIEVNSNNNNNREGS